jgi:hypothetical protein
VERVVVALVIVALAATLALVLRRRATVDSPTQARHLAPSQLDRAEFPGRDREWLLAVFTSATCSACADVVRKANVSESAAVAVAEIEWTAQRALHERYRIDAVPTTVLADAQGVVRASFLGPVTATDLWAAVAEAREPGSSPEPGLGRADPRGPGRPAGGAPSPG